MLSRFLIVHHATQDGKASLKDSKTPLNYHAQRRVSIVKQLFPRCRLPIAPPEFLSMISGGLVWWKKRCINGVPRINQVIGPYKNNISQLVIGTYIKENTTKENKRNKKLPHKVFS